VSILERIVHAFFLGCAVEVVTRQQNTQAEYLASMVLACHDDGPFGNDARSKLFDLAEQHDHGALGAHVRACKTVCARLSANAVAMLNETCLDGSPLLSNIARLYGVDVVDACGVKANPNRT
jgi:hypothetical protein